MSLPQLYSVMGTVVLPGELIEPSSSSGVNDKQIIGYGVERLEGDRLVSTQPGILRSTAKKQWISVQARRYVPERGDAVLGVVTGKIGDLFKVDIGSADLAFLSYLAFEGATKRNRPTLKTGDLLYARVISTSKHVEPELSCVDAEQKARGMGVLPVGGCFFRVPLHVARRLLSPKSHLLKQLGEDFKFEITIGLNGRVWLQCDAHRVLVFMRNLILKSEYVVESDIPAYVEREIRRFKGFEQPEKMETQ